ncbi:hypothetical protein HDU93_009107 [Gonapodya sp. JEL0774]|nr:hypothetical protein HDU93_009107 [Gonapodya sp. JEL0774]
MRNGHLISYLSKHSHVDRIELIFDIACAMQYLHARGILHCDLKGVNVLVDDLGNAHVADFGFATVAARVSILTRVRRPGTVRWMAPELFLPIPRLSEKSDVYAFAMTIYEMYTLQIPFAAVLEDSSVPHIAEKGHRPDIDDFSDVLEDDQLDVVPIPKDVQALVRQCWHPEPEIRYTFTEIVAFLQLHFPQLQAPAEQRNANRSAKQVEDRLRAEFAAKERERERQRLEEVARHQEETEARVKAQYEAERREREQERLDREARIREEIEDRAKAQYEAERREREQEAQQLRLAMQKRVHIQNAPAAEEVTSSEGMWEIASDQNPSEGNPFSAIRNGLSAMSIAGGAASTLQVPKSQNNTIRYSGHSEHSAIASQSKYSNDSAYTSGAYGDGYSPQTQVRVLESDQSDILALPESHLTRGYFFKAINGDSISQFQLGVCYYNGDGVAKDFGEAVKWYRKAADQGLDIAQYSLGLCYKNGEGVAEDFGEAVKWLMKAADQGLGIARYSLGLRYYNGEGVAKDFGEAVKWWRKAADQGVKEAQDHLGLSYKNGEGVAKDFGEAVKWWRKAAEQGHADAQYCLGLSYYYGEGVAKDFGEAVKWWRKAADQGHADAQNRLGFRYYNGEGVAKDFGEAVKWFRKAADQGHPEAIRALQGLACK